MPRPKSQPPIQNEDVLMMSAGLAERLGISDDPIENNKQEAPLDARECPTIHLGEDLMLDLVRIEEDTETLVEGLTHISKLKDLIDLSPSRIFIGFRGEVIWEIENAVIEKREIEILDEKIRFRVWLG